MADILTIKEQQQAEDATNKGLRQFLIEAAADELVELISRTKNLPTEIYEKSINLLNALGK